MIRLKKILFPVDFSDRCLGAAHAVGALAQRFDVEVVALHVVESVSADSTPENRLNQARHEMEKLIVCELIDCKTTPCVIAGDPAVRIVEHARSGRFDLMMMPTHGYGPFRRFLLGSVTAKVLHDAGCPVWTGVHLEYWPVIKNLTLQNVLCGIDCGPRSSAVLTCASQVAAVFGANLTIAHVIPMFDTPPSSRQWRDRAAKAAEETVCRIEAELDICANVEILDGSPAWGLRDPAERLNADLMVIGRTHVAADAAKLGSNAYAIIAHSPCPVLSV